MPKISRPVASSFIASVAMSCGAKPPVRTVIKPSATALMARVKIIDGTRRYATPTPLMSPNASPHRMPTGMAKVAPHGPHPAAAVDIIPPTVMIHGTERSICPSRITIIMPVETRARKEPTWSCCSRYSGDRKFSLTMLPMSSSTTMQPNAVRTAGSNRRRTGLAALRLLMALPEQIEPVADTEQSERAEADRDQQDNAEEQRLPQRIEIEHEQQVADGAVDERAEDRTDRAAAPAEQRHAAEHDGGDRDQRVGVGVGTGRFAGIAHERDEQPADCREQAGERVGGELGALDMQVRHVGGRFRGTHGIDDAAQHRLAERNPDHQHDHQQRNGAGGDATGQLSGQEVRDALVNLAAGEWAEQKGNAEERRAGRDGGHDRLQAAVDHVQAVERTAGKASQQHAENSERRL